MNIQSFYEYVILRDILAYILPGGISLVGVSIIIQALGNERWDKLIPSSSNLSSFLVSTFIVMLAFLIGHILDMLYRLIFQGRDAFRCPNTIRRILVGSKTVFDPISSGIRESVGEFLNVDWKETSIEKWIESGKAYEANVILAYWVEQEDAKLFGNEIGRPIVQSHLLHVSGLAFLFLGLSALISEAIHMVGVNPLQASDPITLSVVVGTSWLFGWMLLRQGAHKREIIIEHTFRVFYVLWRKRVIEQKVGLAEKKYKARDANGHVQSKTQVQQKTHSPT